MSHRTRVLFDGACSICQGSVRWLRRLDWRRRLDYVDVRQEDDPRLADVQVQPEMLLEQMHVVTENGAVLRGFAGLRHLAGLLPPLWPVAPWLWLPGAAWLGQRAYAWVARNRFGLGGCRDGLCAVGRK